VIQRALCGALVLLAACGGGAASNTPKVTPTTSSEQAVEQFMKAVADSNLAKMATLWGSSKGSAAQTGQPIDYPRRIVVIQAYLRGATPRIVSADPAGPAVSQRLVNVELRRDQCVKTVPFQTAKAPSGNWVITSIDLAAVGTPGRACTSESQAQ
jgi:hypothetical protein